MQVLVWALIGPGRNSVYKPDVPNFATGMCHDDYQNFLWFPWGII